MDTGRDAAKFDSTAAQLCNIVRNRQLLFIADTADFIIANEPTFPGRHRVEHTCHKRGLWHNSVVLAVPAIAHLATQYGRTVIGGTKEVGLN